MMAPLKRAENSVLWYLEELGARVVAESRTPSDRHHLGKLILRSLRDAPDFVLQRDAATDQSEDFKSVLKRTVQCATAFKKLGLKTGDHIVLMAPNHLDLVIPYYAALYIGIGMSPLDPRLNTENLQPMFTMVEPKMIFCQNERVPFIKEALKNVNLDATVVTFDDSEDCVKFSGFLEKYGHDADTQAFKASDFNPADTTALLTSTSGTTGLPKAACLTHENFIFALPTMWRCCTRFPTPTRLVLIDSPLQWIRASIHLIFSAIVRYSRIQSSDTITSENLIPIVQKYKPSYMLISPPLLTSLMKPENVAKCDMTCFDYILVGGSAVSKQLFDTVKKVSPKTVLLGFYGMSEVGGPAFYDEHPAPGSVGRALGHFDYRLVNPETKEDIAEPFVNGELWLRGPSVCKGYYKQPEETKEAFEDGWFKTGDIFYRDENYFFYFVERLKMMLNYKNHQISPLELESVIRQHPGVLDVAVTGVPGDNDGDLPIACVVPHAAYQLTAQEIKDLVKNSLSDPKQLRGGVVFMEELPLTASTKINRRRLREMMTTAKRE